MSFSDSFSISTTLRGTQPRGSFKEIKEVVLGKGYHLSLVFIGKRKARSLNLQYRNKNKPANILSFPLDKHTGEIYICVECARAEAKKFEHTEEGHVLFLFIHGVLHLKGYQHGSTMEKKELELCRQFNIR